MVTPHGGLAPTFLGDESELSSGVGDEDAAASRPAHEIAWSATVMADEAGTFDWRGGAALPLDALAFGAPLTHAWQIRY
jgi:hypothetical protein